MKYWGYFLAKLVAIASLLKVLWSLAVAMMPQQQPFMKVKLEDPFARDLNYTIGIMLIWLIGVGLGYLAWLDQRYRCRTCLRPLRMPVGHGGWQYAFLRPPRTDYICPFGHGTLRVPEVHFVNSSSRLNWEPSRDMWEELHELETAGRK